MRDATPKVPHFLRVVRALAGVRSAAFPIAAVATTVVAGFHCGMEAGVVGVIASTGGGGTATTTTHTGTGGSSTSSTSASSGGFVGMGGSATDAGSDGSLSDAGDAGH